MQLTKTKDEVAVIFTQLNKIFAANALCLLLLWSSSSVSDDLILGLGISDVLDGTDNTSGIAVVEYHTEPFLNSGRLSSGFGFSLENDYEDNDLFVGIGLASMFVLTRKVFFETSLMPGYFEPGEEANDLGGNFQFRSVFGLGYKISHKSMISFAITHISNASIESRNPGSESLLIRYRVKYDGFS